jgi:predicted RNA-binding protein YlxR (DUF448 family)
MTKSSPRSASYRICASCRRKQSQGSMLRLRVDHVDGSVFIASAPGMPTIKNRSGRSAYLCLNSECLEEALKKKGSKLRYALQGRQPKHKARRELVWPLDDALIKQALVICEQARKTCQNSTGGV